jgi:hypothetical protein
MSADKETVAAKEAYRNQVQQLATLFKKTPFFPPKPITFDENTAFVQLVDKDFLNACTALVTELALYLPEIISRRQQFFARSCWDSGSDPNIPFDASKLHNFNVCRASTAQVANAPEGFVYRTGERQYRFYRGYPVVWMLTSPLRDPEFWKRNDAINVVEALSNIAKASDNRLVVRCFCDTTVLGEISGEAVGNYIVNVVNSANPQGAKMLRKETASA